MSVSRAKITKNINYVIHNLDFVDKKLKYMHSYELRFVYQHANVPYLIEKIGGAFRVDNFLDMRSRAFH